VRVRDAGSVDVDARGLRKAYGDRTVVDGLNFRLDPGVVTGLVGPNGSGKTTTLKLMLGLARGSGTTLFGGRSLREIGTPQGTVGVMFEGRFGHPGTTAMNYLRSLGRLHRVPDAVIVTTLERVGLGHARLETLNTFSLGMAQRLNVAAAVLCDPAVLIVDEPTNGLDPEGVLMVRSVIQGCAERGGTVLFSSHLLSEVQAISDRLMVMANGSIVADALTDDFQGLYGDHRVIVTVEDQAGMADALRSAGAFYEELGGRSYAVRGIPRDDLGPLLHRSGIAVCELRDEYQSLEELFFKVTGTGAVHR
jgi:ABC-2 type transport system ATP-binding protein